MFTFIPELLDDNDYVSIEYFREALKNLETIYHTRYRPISSSVIVEEMKTIHKVYNSRGLNFIHWLIFYSADIGPQHLDFLKYLYQIGMDFTVEDERGYLLLDLAIEKNNYELTKWLIEDVKLDIDNERIIEHPIVKLFKSNLQSNTLDSKFIKLFILLNTHLPSHSSLKNTLLMIATRANCKEMVKWLIHRGANVNAHNSVGKTALNFAIMYSDQEMISDLIAFGASLESVDNDGRHILHYLANFGYLELIRKYQEDKQVDLSSFLDKDHSSLMFYAVQSSNLALVQYLLAHGLGIYHTNAEPYSIVLNACKSKTTDILKWLLEQGHIQLFEIREDGTREWIFDNHYQQPIHHAAQLASIDVVKWLVEEMGADINVENHRGITPLFMVSAGNESEDTYQVVRYLLQKGANKKINVKISIELPDEQECDDVERPAQYELSFSHDLLMKGHIDTLFDLMHKGIIDICEANLFEQNIFDMVMLSKNVYLIERMRLFLITYHLVEREHPIPIKTFACYPLFLDYLFTNKLISLYDFDGEGDTVIHAMVRFSKPSLAIELMDSLKGLNVNFKNELGESILSIVVKRNDLNFFKNMITSFGWQLDFYHINPQGEHLMDMLKSNGKQEWLDWLCENEDLKLNLDALHALFFEILQHQSFSKIMNFCRRYLSSLDFSKADEQHQKKPLAIMLERFEDHEILEFLTEFPHKQVFLKLNSQQDDFFDIMRRFKRQTLMNHLVKTPIDNLNIDSLVIQVCRKEPRVIVLEFCRTYQQVNLSQEVCLFSPLQYIFKRNDDELLKKFVSQFFGERLQLDRIDKDGNHFLHHLMQERRSLLNWFCNQKLFPVLPLSEDQVKEEILKIYAEQNDWQRYFFKHYLTPSVKKSVMDGLMQTNEISVLISLMKSKVLPFDATDIYENNVLVQVLSQGNTQIFEQLMLNFYIGHPQTESIIRQTFDFWNNHPDLLPKEVWIDYMRRTQDKVLIELAINHLQYDWKIPNEEHMNLFDILYQNQQIASLEWMLKSLHVGLTDTRYQAYFQGNKGDLKDYLAIFRRIYAAKSMKSILEQFDFDVACAAMQFLNKSDALDIFRDIKNWCKISDVQQTLLHICVLRGRSDLFSFILEKTISLVHHQDQSQKTALNYAAERNQTDMMEALSRSAHR